MKKILILLSTISLLGAGCTSAEMKPSYPDSSANFEKKKECAELLKEFDERNKADQIFTILHESRICYSQKYNTCMGILVHQTPRTQPNQEVILEEFNIVDLLTNKSISHDAFAGNPNLSSASYREYDRYKSESIKDVDCVP